MKMKQLAPCLFCLMMMAGFAGAQTIPSCNSTQTITVTATIEVKEGQTFDGGCKRYIAGSALGDGSQSESQKPMFKLRNGATLLNIVIGAPAADGIHTWGNATLRNIHWLDVGEDALSIKKPGNVTLDGGSAFKADDKVFQINQPSTFTVRNFKSDGAGKFIRQNGGKTFKVSLFIDRCDIANMKESIARTDSPVTTVRMTSTRYHNVPTKFIGFAAANVSESGNTQY